MRVPKTAMAAAVAAIAALSGVGPARANAPSRYHCVNYDGHGYRRCNGGYGSNDDPNWGAYRPPSDSSECPRPHSHTGYPYGPGCGQEAPTRAQVGRWSAWAPTASTSTPT